MQLFLSHSWEDKPLVLELLREVERMAPDTKVWLDADHLRPGDSIVQEVENAVASSDVVVVIWTEAAQRSRGVRHEVEHALAVGKLIVACPVTGIEGPPPPLPDHPRWRDRLPYTLAMTDPWTSEQIGLVAGALVNLLLDTLSSDPEVDLPDLGEMWRYLLRMAATLRHVEAMNHDEVHGDLLAAWAEQIELDLQALAVAGGHTLDRLGSSIQLLDRVVEEVQRIPTDIPRLRNLRHGVEELASSDPVAARQALKVIDMRLQDPL